MSCTGSCRNAVGTCECCGDGAHVDYILVICNSNSFADDDYDVYLDGDYIDSLAFGTAGCTGKAWSTDPSIPLGLLDLSATNPDDGVTSDGHCCDGIAPDTMDLRHVSKGPHTLFLDDTRADADGAFGVVVLARVYFDGANYCVLDYPIKSIYHNTSPFDHRVPQDQTYAYSIPCPPLTGTSCTLACSPCGLPKRDLCLRWFKDDGSSGTTTLVYNSGTVTWDTGCTHPGASSDSWDMTVGCAGGSMSCDVEGDEDSTGCVSPRTHSLANGHLTIDSGATNCDPLHIVLDVTPSSRLATSQHYTQFVISELPCQDCYPCVIPSYNLTVSWTGAAGCPIGTSGSGTLALTTSGGVNLWSTGCTVVTIAAGPDPGSSIIMTMKCGADGEIDMIVTYSGGSTACTFASYTGRPSATGTYSDGSLILSSFTCSPFVFNFTVKNPSALYSFGLRTLTVTL